MSSLANGRLKDARDILFLLDLRRRLCDLLDKVTKNKTRNYIQKASTEYGIQCNLLPPRQFHTADDDLRNYEGIDVAENAKSTNKWICNFALTTFVVMSIGDVE